VIQLGGRVHKPAMSVSAARRIEILEEPSTINAREMMYPEYPMKDALKKELELDPRISERLSRGVKQAIVKLVSLLKLKLDLYESHMQLLQHRLNESFSSDSDAVGTVCAEFGISENIVEAGWSSKFQTSSLRQFSGRSRGCIFLPKDEAHELHRIQDHDLFVRIDCMIYGFGLATAALMQYSYKASDLWLTSRVVNGQDLGDYADIVSKTC